MLNKIINFIDGLVFGILIKLIKNRSKQTGDSEYLVLDQYFESLKDVGINFSEDTKKELFRRVVE
jgi:hypothetical protein